MKAGGLTITFDSPEELQLLVGYIWDNSHPIHTHKSYVDFKMCIYAMNQYNINNKVVENISKNHDVLDKILDRVESDDIVD